MSFDPANSKTPTSVSPLRVVLLGHDTPADDTIEYTFVVYDQDGNVMERRQGNAVPILTATEITQLQTMMARWKALQLGVLP